MNPSGNTNFEQIQYSVESHVATLTLYRPDAMNAFTARMVHELCAALDLADGDDEVRAVIVTGHGDRAFCAGADLSAGGDTFDYTARADAPEADAGATRADSGVRVQGVVRDGGGIWTLRIFGSRKPIIGAVNGAAVGIGATMLLPMDIRLASTTARFGFVFSRRGITPEAASGWFLPRVVGISKALEWCYSGRIFGAEEALAAGLVRSVHEPDELLPAARALAAEIADQAAPVSVGLARQLMWRGLTERHPMEAHRYDSRAIQARGRSADAREGVTAFLEKRPAGFTDRVSTDLPDVFPGWVEPQFE